MNSNLQTKNFLNIKDQFSLGHLTTEQPHSLTVNLSQNSAKNLNLAIEQVQNVDIELFQKLSVYFPQVAELQRAIAQTFKNHKKVFICGCGATGRLALTLETLVKRYQPQYADQVVSFMAGGDFALIKSVEAFEDSFEFAHRQLAELGFSEGDMLIGCSEGGETSFVIGAVERAELLSKQQSYFLYCNPDSDLMSIVRSKRILENEDIRCFSIQTGPMALSGSTRLQATTALLFILGLALMNTEASEAELDSKFKNYLCALQKVEYQKLHELILKEAAIYEQGGHINYTTSSELAITVLTDTTERSPTFNLAPFKSRNSSTDLESLSYLIIKESHDAQGSWESMLGRKVRGLDWDNFELGDKAIYDFDISQNALSARAHLAPCAFDIEQSANAVHFELDTQGASFDLTLVDPLYVHLQTKILLNTHSTLVMGRLNRYYSNLMTWVRPSNLKLIDRAIRYSIHLLNEEKRDVSYEKVAEVLFRLTQTLSTEPIVMRVYSHLKG